MFVFRRASALHDASVPCCAIAGIPAPLDEHANAGGGIERPSTPQPRLQFFEQVGLGLLRTVVFTADDTSPVPPSVEDRVNVWTLPIGIERASEEEAFPAPSGNAAPVSMPMVLPRPSAGSWNQLPIDDDSEVPFADVQGASSLHAALVGTPRDVGNVKV